MALGTPMTDTTLPDLPGGPYDLEFFFDPGCPFAWQTSVWIRQVADLRDLQVGWRFISLAHINRDKDHPDAMRKGQEFGRNYLRICAAARERLGNEAVGDLYEAYGKAFWYQRPPDGADFAGTFAAAREAVDPVKILADLGLPADLVEAADDPSWDALLAAESDGAFDRTGPDVGTPIITYGPPDGLSLFGPVISTTLDDETALRLYDAVRTLTEVESFAELKRSKRPPFDLPLLQP